MSLKNILALSVLVCLSTYYAIEGEIIREVDIPKLNVSKIVGKWYLLGGTVLNDGLSCMINTIEQQSENNFTMNIEITFIPSIQDRYVVVAGNHNILNASIENDSSIINFRLTSELSSVSVIFDVKYDSYMATYATQTMAELNNGTEGRVLIFSREKTLSNDIYEKIKNSNFVKQGLNSTDELIHVNATNYPRLRCLDADESLGDNTNWVLGDLRTLHRCVPALRRTGIDVAGFRSHFYPEGGWGWLVCAAGFLALLLTTGMQLAFGLLHLQATRKWVDIPSTEIGK
ncbi:hypothetical protein PV327_005610 [Microctonus hyperodae]|uniref:Uncharacterized protein n=1 Tax=Microctonus hyperodae TaxID=165561 RepID=A0AA39L009_MICHY|nr:hypothetical protein PV327_005610 [Microctonus hyperodae]